MLDVRRLRLLHELKLRGTIAAVAKALSFTPSAVSQQLSLLEREAGVELLQPVGRRVQLTAQGEVLAEHARWLLTRLEQAESDVARSFEVVSGTVRVAVFQSAAHAIVPRALTLLAEEYPALRVEVSEREPEEALFEVAARDFDLVIAEQYPGVTRAHRPDLDRRVLTLDPIRLALPAGSGGALADARDRAWVMEPRGTAARDWATQCCRAAGFEPDVRFETADLMAHIRLIRSGNAVGFLPDLVWAGSRPDVELVTLGDEPHREVFTSARLSAADRPGVEACRDALARAVTSAHSR